MTQITLKDVMSGADAGILAIATTTAGDPNLTLDTIGLAVHLATQGGTANLEQLAEQLAYAPQCLRPIADDLAAAGYAEITDGGAA